MSVQRNLPVCLFICLSRNLLYNRTSRFRFEKHLSASWKKKLEQLSKEPCNFTKERNETFKFEQKPLDIDDFNNTEEEEVYEKIEERKKKRRKIAEKKKQIAKMKKKVR